MMNSEIENEEKVVDIRIWGIPESYLEDWLRIVKIYSGNRKLAFRAVLDAYHFALLFGKMNMELKLLDERLRTLEYKWQKEGGNLKVFGVKQE